MKHIYLIGFVLLACNKYKEVKLSGRYKIAYSQINDAWIVDDKDIMVIYGRVVDYGMDKNFIVAAQKHRDSVPRKSNLREKEEFFDRSTFRQYWIINVKTDSIYGPFKKEAYLVMKESLNVPKEISDKIIK